MRRSFDLWKPGLSAPRLSQGPPAASITGTGNGGYAIRGMGASVRFAGAARVSVVAR